MKRRRRMRKAGTAGLANKVYDHMNTHGMTQTQFASEAGISPMCLSRFLTGKATPNSVTIGKIRSVIIPTTGIVPTTTVATTTGVYATKIAESFKVVQTINNANLTNEEKVELLTACINAVQSPIQ